MDYLSLCLICKDENDYLPEWLDYHILAGVDRFYIYDNESQINLRETLDGYIKRGWVVVLDIYGKAMQLYAYDHCLQTFGANSFWMGFIDTDEFLVPKTTFDLKELLKDYETFGGIAVSSLFFGSNGHKTRPAFGQTATYTQHVHTTFNEYELVKNIVQPSLVMMPNSPHDFTYKEGSWCVNEEFMRVDGQRFPISIKKIQINHYYCRSEQEIDLKLHRGNSGDIAWPRKRFEIINQLAVFEDTSIIQNLNNLFIKAGIVEKKDAVNSLQTGKLLENMAVLAETLTPAPLDMPLPHEAAIFRGEFSNWMDLKVQGMSAKNRGDFQQVCKSLLDLIHLQPQYPSMYIELAINYLNLNKMDEAWLTLSQTWQLAPNTYSVQVGMALYFLQMKNYLMAEKTCHVLLEIAPHSLAILGLLTQSLIGQGRFEEALKIGAPVIGISAQVGELPYGMGGLLIKKMADYLMKKKDYEEAILLLECGVICQPDDVSMLIELSRALLLAGDKQGASKRLAQACMVAPHDKRLLTFLDELPAHFMAGK